MRILQDFISDVENDLKTDLCSLVISSSKQRPRIRRLDIEIGYAEGRGGGYGCKSRCS